MGNFFLSYILITIHVIGTALTIFSNEEVGSERAGQWLEVTQLGRGEAEVARVAVPALQGQDSEQSKPRLLSPAHPHLQVLLSQELWKKKKKKNKSQAQMGAPGASLACLLLPAGPQGFCKPPMWLLGAHFLSPPYISVSHFLNFFFPLVFFFPIRKKSFLHNDDLCLLCRSVFEVFQRLAELLSVGILDFYLCKI